MFRFSKLSLCKASQSHLLHSKINYLFQFTSLHSKGFRLFTNLKFNNLKKYSFLKKLKKMTEKLLPNEEPVYPKYFWNNREALNELKILLNDFFKDVKLSPLQLLAGLYWLASHQKEQELPVFEPLPLRNTPLTPEQLKMQKILEDGKYFMKFASATYGWKLIIGYMKEKRNKVFEAAIQRKTSLDAANRLALRLHCNIQDEDILYEAWKTADVYVPAHFLVVDKNRNIIVLAIRGTLSVSDVVTDLISRSVPFKGGKAHQGILEAANRLYSSLKVHLVNALQKFPDYSIVICGHSLGAGVATLITLLINDEFPNFKVQCYAYGPPPVVSESLSNNCEHFIFTFIHGKDLIPRLSYYSVYKLFKKVEKSYYKTGETTQQTLSSSLSENLDAPPDETQHKIEMSITESPPPSSHSEERFLHNKINKSQNSDGMLCLTGLIIHMRPSRVGIMTAGLGEKIHFSEIYLSLEMLGDHFPNRYEDCFAQLIPDSDSKNPPPSFFHRYSPAILMGFSVKGVFWASCFTGAAFVFGYFAYRYFFSKAHKNKWIPFKKN